MLKTTELYAKLRPFIQRQINESAQGGGGTIALSSGGDGTFSGIKDPAGTGVVENVLGWILTTDDNVVNVAASGANTLAFSLNQAGITHNNLAGLTTGDPHTQYPLLSGTETVTGLWSFSRGAAAPFGVNSGALVVANLDADRVDGYHLNQDVRTTGTPAFAGLTVNGNITVTGTVDGVDVSAHEAATAAHGATGAVVGTTNTQTLTNKTLTAPVIASIVNTGTLTLPTATDTLVGRATTDTLTNKTLTLPQINDVSADHQYVFAVSELVADRTVTLPLLTGNDTFVFADFTQTLTNKTLTTPTIASFANATHNHSNAAGGGTIAHSVLTGIGANDHHNQSHVLATNAGLGADHTVSGLTARQVLRATGATTAAFGAIEDADLPSTIVRTSRTLTAGVGLTGGGDLSADRTFAVGAGLGITVNADDVALTTPGSLTATSTNSSTGNHTHAVDSTIARSAITITAGAGLTGGGDLTANRTLDVGAGTMITVNANDVAVTAGATYQFIGTGSGTAAGWRNVSELAGAGLTAATGVLAVGAGLGITVNADDVALTTPGTLTVSTANNSTGSHLHAITSSSNPGAAASLLASSGAGALTLVNLTATTDVVAPLVRATTGVALTLGAGTDVIFSPTSLLTKMASGVSLQSSAYASQTTGWRATDAGEADFRYLFVDEMHAKSFIADLEQALAGGQIISKSVAMVASDFTLPTAGNTGTLRVRDLPSAPNMAVFVSGDFVGMRQFSRAAGSLTIGWAWGTVTSYTDGTGGNEGTQTWTFTRSATAGAATGTISADSLVLDFGTTGNGFYEVNAIDGAYGANSPYAQVVTWATHPATQTVRARFGHLKGIFSVTDEHGLYAGSGTAVTDRYVRASSYAVELRNVPLALYDGANNTMLLSAGAGNNAPVLAMGATLPTGPLVGSGLWMGKDGSDYEFRVGTVSGGVLTAGMHWDGTNLNVSGGGTFTGTVSGGAIVGGVIDIGGADATSFHVDSTGQMWLGHASYASAPFKVSAAGAVAAISGTVGGWTLAATTLAGTNITLGSSGYATFGSGNNILKIDTTSPSEIFWVGHANFVSAPFRVSAAGEVTIEGAAITTTNTGLHILDTNASHDLIIAPGSDLSADTTLTLTMTANRTLTISGSATLNDWFDQNVKTTGTPTFAQVTIDNLVLNGNTLSSTSGVVAITPLAGQNIQVSLSSGGLVDVRSAEPVVRITNTSSLSSPGWDDTVVGDLDFYTTDVTTNYVASVVARVRAVASAVSGNVPVSDLSFWTGSGNDGATPSHVLSEKMRILYNGDVLIGTTVSNGYKLEVNGGAWTSQLTVDNLRLDGNTISSASGAINATPLAGQNISLTTSGGGLSEVVDSALATLRLRNTDSTLVGQQIIGEVDFYGSDASVGGARTGVYASIRALAARGALASLTDIDGSANEGGDLVFYTAMDAVGSAAIILAERMRLTMRGRLGIGNNDPTYDLDITGTLRATGAAYLTDIRPVSDSTTALQLKRSGGTAVMTVDTTNSRVGINKTPGAFDLDVNGDVNIGSSLEVGLDLYTSSVRAATDGVLGIKFGGNSSPSYVMAVDTTNSRVAIGDGHTASYTLDVLGAIKYSTHLRIAETASTPASLSSSAEGAIYIKSDKLVIAFNDAGTVRYKYLDLTGTGVTWVHTTTAP